MTDIIQDIETVVASLRDPIIDPLAKGAGSPYFEYGHRHEIAMGLDIKNLDNKYKYQKFPLIALRLDIPEIKTGGGITEYSLNLAIVESTQKQYNARQRKANVFDPILEPLYVRFMEALKTSGLFFWQGQQYEPPHTKINRYFWGTPGPEKNEKNIFNEPIDAIEIINLRLKKLPNC